MSHVLSVTRISGGHDDSSWACAAHVDPEHVVGEGRARVVALSGEYFQSISLVLSPLLASRHAVQRGDASTVHQVDPVDRGRR